MAGATGEQALARIETALARIETAANGKAAASTVSEAPLRAVVADTLARLDALIAGLRSVSNVALSIGGRSFTVACADGEEGHIRGLGATIDSKLTAMGGAAGQSEARMLLFACLLLADELHDAQNGGAPAPVVSGVAPAQLDALATRLENLAAHLER